MINQTIKAAEQGYIEAQYELKKSFESGEDIEKDMVEASGSKAY